MARALEDIASEIQTVEARLAALRTEQVLAVIPSDWQDLIMDAVRQAMREADFTTYGQAQHVKLGDYAALHLRLDVNDPRDCEEDQENGEDEI